MDCCCGALSCRPGDAGVTSMGTCEAAQDCPLQRSGHRSWLTAWLQGKGEGQVQLRITYFPFELLYSKPRDASLVGAPEVLSSPSMQLHAARHCTC